MTRRYFAHVVIPLGVIEADDITHANELAAEKLEHLSGSNDGSEALANARPVLTFFERK